MATSRLSEDDRTSEIAIFARLLKANDYNLSPELARYILTLGFDEKDQARMRELAERNRGEPWPHGNERTFRTTSRPGTGLPFSTPRPGDRWHAPLPVP